MPINPLNHHYSMENPASVYDEEAMTALELAGRTTAKVNECVAQINKNTESLPGLVEDKVQGHIDSGKFDTQINHYAGDLEKQMAGTESRMQTQYDELEDSLGNRLNALLSQVQTGSTSMDAEIIDARTGGNGRTYGSLGASIANQVLSANRHAQAVVYAGATTPTAVTTNDQGDAIVEIGVDVRLTCKANGEVTYLEWATVTADIPEYYHKTEKGHHVLRCPNGHALLYDTLLGKFKLDESSLNNSKFTDVVCVMNQFANPFTGSLIDEAMYKLYSQYGAHANQFCYIGLGKTLEVYQADGQNMAFRTNGGLNWWAHDDHTWAPWQDVCAYIPENVVTDESGVTTVTIPSTYCLTFDIFEKQLNLKRVFEMGTHDILLFSNINTQLFTGCIVEQYTARLAQEYGKEKKVAKLYPDAVKTFAGRFKGLGDTESFLFFADPHLMGDGSTTSADNLDYYLSCVSAGFHSAPVDFAVCAGDWLNSGDTPEQALYKLGLVNGSMRKHFGDKFRQVLGNHDTNYQGTEQLGRADIANVFFRATGSTYYKFSGKHTTFFVFDTGTDWDPAITTQNRTEQVVWFANELKTTSGNIGLFGHIYKSLNADTAGAPMADLLTQIARAYNNRTSITVNGQVFNYAGATGKVRFYMAGHSHLDMTGTLNGIPVTATDMLTSHETGTYDLVLVDYKNNKMYLDRVGTGESRVIDI